MRQHQSELDERNVIVKVVAFDNDFMAKAYKENTGLDWPMLLDPDMHTYEAYGLQTSSWWGLINPVAIFKYVWLILKGRFPGKPGSDFRQLGGDVLIDPDGIVRMHYVSENPHDRPSVQSILAAIDGE